METEAVVVAAAETLVVGDENIEAAVKAAEK